ncbi:MAG: hypothetical protein IJE00_06615 [Clostridia bacterium]|nr:hypothetical protein [Clostridia bacterium]
MREARIFRENGEPILVTAEAVKNGQYSRHEEFVDPEYEFKVIYVNGARNNGAPHFRLYLADEDYKRLSPEQKNRYDIVSNMRRFQESKWHKKWEENVSDFCEIEKYKRNPFTGKWKRADAYYGKHKIVIEFQHSYIALEFEERNSFYKEIGLKTIWLYDLPKAHVRFANDGNIEILEDNARGFFKIADFPENLKNHLVYIQVKTGQIYRIKELHRRSSSTELKSTIRYFSPSEVYAEKEFIEAIRNGQIVCDEPQKKLEDKCARALTELWKPNYRWMTVENVKTKERIVVNRGINGEMFRDYKTGYLKYKYEKENGRWIPKDYFLNTKKETEKVWVIVKYGKDN